MSLSLTQVEAQVAAYNKRLSKLDKNKQPKTYEALEQFVKNVTEVCYEQRRGRPAS